MLAHTCGSHTYGVSVYNTAATPRRRVIGFVLSRATLKRALGATISAAMLRHSRRVLAAVEKPEKFQRRSSPFRGNGRERNALINAPRLSVRFAARFSRRRVLSGSLLNSRIAFSPSKRSSVREIGINATEKATRRRKGDQKPSSNASRRRWFPILLRTSRLFSLPKIYALRRNRKMPATCLHHDFPVINHMTTVILNGFNASTLFSRSR